MKKVLKVCLVKLSLIKSNPPALFIDARGVVPTSGWSGAILVPFVYITPPPDGYWEFDFVARPPSGPAADVITPISATHTWDNFPEDSLKGVTVYASLNSVRTPFKSTVDLGEEVPWPW